ncbi:MAG: hypothetical protein KGI67_06565 [Pseudomonadota bacterium]|nr:hypothetical protein [Pseudomonadota bacterium]
MPASRPPKPPRRHEHEHEHVREHGHEHQRCEHCGGCRRCGCCDAKEDRDHARIRRIEERIWYFDDDDRHAHPPCDPDPCHDHPGQGGGGPGPGGGGSGGHGGRPGRPPGHGTGRVPDGGPLTGGDINGQNPPGVFVGPRGDLDLPFLFMRANPGDLGARPVIGAPFWESPDIFILAGVAPDAAPDVPPALGQVGLAGKPNTLYAHVWNFGKAAAPEVLVEFYWVNPSLGIDASSVQLIAQTTASIGARGSGRSHVMVKCPQAWTPTFVNGGHECLLVRVWDNPSDLPGEPKFDAAWNRHVAQRNIHVAQPGTFPMAMLRAARAGVAAAAPAALPAAALTQPLLLQVGRLYGAPAQVKVERVAPPTMPWLQLHTGQRGVFPAMAPPSGAPTLTPPGQAGGGTPAGPGAPQHQVHGDGQQIGFASSDAAPAPGEAHVYRVSASQDGHVFGGYTVVVLG